MFKFVRNTIKISVVILSAGCAGDVIEEAYYDSDSPAARAWRDKSGNPGPNAPGYVGPDGEFSLYQDNDPH